MKHLSRTLPVLISILIALVINSGCRENTLINSKVSPSNNSVGVYDTTLSCITHTYYDDTVVTSAHFGSIPVYQGVGTYTDPYFGTMIAATYFNVIPADYSPILDSLVDSAILILPYSGLTYGDTITKTLTQTYQVFYMQDTIDINGTYYSYSTKPIDVAHPLSDPATVSVYPLKDSFGINVLTQNQAGLRIKLNLPAVKSRLLPALNNLGNSSNATADFLHAFNGICVQVADTRQMNTAIPYFRLDGASTYSEAGILLYHHLAGSQTSIGTSFFYDIGTCAHFNSVTKSYSHFPVNNLFQSTQANDQVIALQNKPGASLDIVVPGIKSLLNKGIITKAELQLTLLPGYGNYVRTSGGDSILFAPERLSPTGVANSTYPTGIGNGLLYYIADMYPIYSNSPLNVIDGTLHNITKNGTALKTFTIGIPREVMASIAAKNDTIHLHLDGTLDFYGAFHMVAGGGNYPDSLYRAKLFVVYSKLKN